MYMNVCFFFSSRRRHTRSLCDWSSDVCSSDLADLYAQTVAYGLLAARCWEDGELDRRTLYERIPPASGILRDVFRYISLSPPPEIEQIVDGLIDLLRPAALKRS